MPTRTRGVRVSAELEREITRLAEERGQSWSAVMTELVDEAIRMRRAPGIVFLDGPSGRRAVIAGTGLDVWEVVAVWQDCGRSYDELKPNFDWLSDTQLRAALSYYVLYPDEVDRRLAREKEWTPDRIRAELPFSVPPKP